jgi:hypothetical protein
LIYSPEKKKNNDHHDTLGNISVGDKKMGLAVIAPNENIFTLFCPISGCGFDGSAHLFSLLLPFSCQARGHNCT